MTYGIAGNIAKDELWAPVASLATWLTNRDIDWCLHAPVARGLAKRSLVPPDLCRARSTRRLADRCDLILSFGGDGTLLRAAHEVNESGTPILGINVGHLGFLADVELAHVKRAIELLEAGEYDVEERMALAVDGKHSGWALNDVVVTRAGAAGLIALDVTVDNTPLNRYWADGLIVATPTGSTAYSLAVGGPIVMPGSEVVLVSPIASHSLTVRPVVLPSISMIEVCVHESPATCVLALDGRTVASPDPGDVIRIKRAAHAIRLVSLPGQHYFKTLRSKLSWGVGPQQRG